MSTATWYYSKNGTRSGPFTIDQMKGFAASGVIGLETKVWTGSGDWVSLKDTELAANVAPLSGPPPLASSEVDNRFVWGLVGIQILGILMALTFDFSIGWLVVLANIGLSVADERRLKAAGYAAPETYWAIVVPVYLWKRANILGHAKTYFYAWIVSFIVLAMTINFADEQLEIEKAACPLVTDIIHDQFHQTSSCLKVAIDDEPRDDFYRATAYLDNGREVDITIQKKKDQIFVRIPL